jgi:hypothetical protein
LAGIAGPDPPNMPVSDDGLSPLVCNKHSLQLNRILVKLCAIREQGTSTFIADHLLLLVDIL